MLLECNSFNVVILLLLAFAAVEVTNISSHITLEGVVVVANANVRHLLRLNPLGSACNWIPRQEIRYEVLFGISK